MLDGSLMLHALVVSGLALVGAVTLLDMLGDRR